MSFKDKFVRLTLVMLSQGIWCRIIDTISHNRRFVL